MLKCIECFRKNLPNAWVPGFEGHTHYKDEQPGHYKPAGEQREEQRIAMEQSRTAETMLNGNAFCAEHATDRLRGY